MGPYSLYLGDTNGQADDAGWSDGWDFDGLRSTLVQPRSDSQEPAAGRHATDVLNYVFGSAHPGGINALFADGSVTGINFDVDLETFNRSGKPPDGETMTQEFLISIAEFGRRRVFRGIFDIFW